MNFTRIASKGLLLSCLCIALLSATATQAVIAAPNVKVTHVTDLLPADYVTDGSVSYQPQIQQAIDAAALTGGEVIFAPITYRIDNPAGLRISSNLTLTMNGATFLFGENCGADGQLFFGENVTDVRFHGGTIIGRNDVWSEGINIRGIYLVGECRNIRIEEMQMRDLSSNGVGVFAEDAEHPATDIRILDTIVDNCCNKYGDYQAPANRGPEKGSKREDQGLVALYHVHDFTVRGCRLEDSRSDGTHFYFCRRGQFNDNFVYRAKMGGYFLESCRHVLAANNVIRDNGSRGVTIERGSQFCTLNGNTITGSGREGLWIPDSLRCTVTGNIFSLNGRKSNGDERHTIWNANITINQARGDKLNTPTAHYLIADNIIESDQNQVAAIRVDTRPETENIVIHGNLLIGDNRKILVEGPDQQSVTIQQNSGATVERLTSDD